MGWMTVAQTESANPEATAPQPRLVRAAHEFEAQMMKELMKPITQVASGIGDDADGGSGSNGALGEFASESLAQALSQQGGFGIASSIVHSLTPAGNRNRTVPVTANKHLDTVMKAGK